MVMMYVILLKRQETCADLWDSPQSIYYTGIQGMEPFKRDYGEANAPGSKEPYSLGTVFLSVSASIIYAGEFIGAILAAPINDKYGRKAVFASASVCIIIGAIIQLCSYSIAGVFYVGRVFVGLGVGQFTATCLIYVADVAPTVSLLESMRSGFILISCRKFVDRHLCAFSSCKALRS